MKVISTNRSNPQTIIVGGKSEITGYFKKPVNESVFLDVEGVKNDCVADKIRHGGVDKACYLYGYNHYSFWQKKYPYLLYDYGMFGENITLNYLDESKLKIGDVLQIGEAVIQITQPRQPCYKMGVKFNSQHMVNEFRANPYPGIYVRVLQQGFVKKEDSLLLIKSYANSHTVAEIFKLIYSKSPSKKELDKAINNEFIAERLKVYLKSKFQL